MRIRASLSTHFKGQGSVLLVALFVALIIGASLIAFLSLTSQNQRAAARSFAWNSAMPVVEAGIEEAMAHLNSNTTNRACCGWAASGTNVTKTRTFGDGYFAVTVSTNEKNPVITSQGYVLVPTGTNHLRRAVTVDCTSRVGGGIILKERMDLFGNNVVLDSFDSNDPTASTGGLYDVTKRKDNVRIVSDKGFTSDFSVGNANIWGTVSTAPGGVVSCGPMGSIGDLAWHATGSSGIQPGAVTSDAAVTIDPVPTPPGGALSPAQIGVISGKSIWSISSGVYQVTKLEEPMFVYGNCALIVTDSVKLNSTVVLTITSNASLTLFCYGKVQVSGAGIVNESGLAERLTLYGMNTCPEIDFSGGVLFIGQILAPEAEIVGGGGGSTPFSFAGSISAKSMRLNGHINFHYDEALADVRSRRFYVSSWNEL